MKTLESIFYNPGVDGENKEKDASGNVTGWWTIIPVTDNCSPGLEGTVVRYAYVRIKAVCGSGVGNPCGGYSAPPTACSGYGSNVIVVDRIACIDCADASSTPGLHTGLVR